MKISNECDIIPSLWSSSNLGMACHDYQEIKVPSPSAICYHSSLNTLMLLLKAKYQWLGSIKRNISSWLKKYLPRCCLHPTLVVCSYFDHLTYLQLACFNENVINQWFLFCIFQNSWKMNVACPLVLLFPCQSCLQSSNLK